MLGPALAQIRATDAAGPDRIAIDAGEPKYGVVPADIPCAELIPLCRARCCTLSFALSTLDLDEGIVRWDYAKPYLIRRRAGDGYCVHNDPASHACGVHHARPRTCRVYDCRRDPRIWIDFEQRIPAPEDARAHRGPPPPPDGEGFDLLERARARAVALRHERHAITASRAASHRRNRRRRHANATSAAVKAAPSRSAVRVAVAKPGVGAQYRQRWQPRSRALL